MKRYIKSSKALEADQVPENKNSWKLMANIEDPNYMTKRSSFVHDGTKAYKYDTSNYEVFIFCDENETHYYWYVVYTEGSRSSKITFDDTDHSSSDFTSFKDCILDINSFLAPDDPSSFFNPSKYTWKLKPLNDGTLQGLLYLQTKRGVKVGLELISEKYDPSKFTYFGLWNFNNSSRGLTGKAGKTVFMLESQYFGDAFAPTVDDIKTVDKFVDELRKTVGLTPSSRY